MGNTQRPLRAALVSALLAHVSIAALSIGDASAQSASEALRSYHIEAQPLSSALGEYARQSGVQVLFAYDDLRGLHAPAVIGQFSREEALARLLSGTGFIATFDGAGAVLLERAPGYEPISGSSSSGASEEVVVTGSRIRGAAPAGANVIGLDRTDIEESGRTTLSDVLRTLPQVFTGSQSELSQTNSLSPGRNLAFASTVDLRGIGADATLTLVNGRRLAPAGLGNFVDISAIPVSAIERVEVLADGASAAYGADAVGGVVNIVLRRGLDAPETTLRYGLADGFDEQAFSHVLGGAWDGGSFVAGYDYRARSRLLVEDRDFAASSDLRSRGGSNFSRNTANPGNIIRVGATPVQFAIPAGQDGLSLSAGDLLPGVTNFQELNEGAYLLPDQESHSLFGTFRQRLTDRMEVFADLVATQRVAYLERAQSGATISVPQSNYYRQQNGLFAGQGALVMTYWFGEDLGPIQLSTESESLSAAAGLAFDLSDTWRIEAFSGYGAHQDENDTVNALDSASLPAALASSDPNFAFNPFGDGSHTPEAVLARLTQSQVIDTDSELVSYGVKADGVLFDLPGGRARLAVGAERRVESFQASQIRIAGSGAVTTPSLQAPGRREVSAVFAELYLPLLDESAGIAFIDSLAFSLSLRGEHSDDFGDAETPRVGVNWRLSEDLAFRGSWGESFKAPQFTQMLTGIGATIGSLPAMFDPEATNGSTGVLQLLGANPELEPEQAETWTVGFDFTPRWISGLRLSASYFDVDFTNRIGTPGNILQAFQDPSAYPGYFIRNPTAGQIAAYLALATTTSGAVPPDGIEVIWDERLTNLASLRVRGVDLSASYAFDSPLGSLSLSGSSSGLLQFERRSNPALPGVDILDTMGNPVDWRGRFTAALAHGDWRSAVSINYVDAYRDTLSAPNRDIDSWTTVDLRLARGFDTGDGSRVEFALDIRNVGDEDPPFANNPVGMGFDTLNASPLGRVVMFEARRRW